MKESAIKEVAIKGILGFAALLLSVSAWSQANIEGVEFSSLPGDKTEIRLVFDSAPPEPTGYTIEEPARIVLDMPGVVSSLEEKHHNLGIGNARRVSIITTKDRTRAIVNLIYGGRNIKKLAIGWGVKAQ